MGSNYCKHSVAIFTIYSLQFVVPFLMTGDDCRVPIVIALHHANPFNRTN